MAHGVLDPYQGDVPVPMAPSYVPDWYVVRPPAQTKVQERWALTVAPLRALAVGFLWITFAWWRTAILALGVAIIIVLFKVS